MVAVGAVNTKYMQVLLLPWDCKGVVEKVASPKWLQLCCKYKKNIQELLLLKVHIEIKHELLPLRDCSLALKILKYRKRLISQNIFMSDFPLMIGPSTVARSDARPPGMWTVAGSILTSSKTFFHWDLVIKNFYDHSPSHWFKKGSCQLLAKEWALSTGKLPRRLAQEQCD